MKCWKCEAETSDGTAECTRCGDGLGFQAEDSAARSLELDWQSVATVEELRGILEALKLKVYVSEDSPEYYALRKWLVPYNKGP